MPCDPDVPESLGRDVIERVVRFFVQERQTIGAAQPRSMQFVDVPFLQLAHAQPDALTVSGDGNCLNRRIGRIHFRAAVVGAVEIGEGCHFVRFNLARRFGIDRFGEDELEAVVPADYTFTAQDHGKHFFHLTLSATGSQTIDATDTVTASIAGSATTKVNPAPVATQLLVRVPSHVTQGVPTYVLVVAKDASGHLAPNYTGTVSIASSDAAATLPANYTFTADDHGRHVFQVVLPTAGTQTVTATDTATASIAGQVSLTVDAVGPVTHFRVSAWIWAQTGAAKSFQVTALDANNRIVAAYNGTIHLTSTDAAATLPADYTFVAGDYGRHTLSATFATIGKQTLTATDAADGAILGTRKFRVFG